MEQQIPIPTITGLQIQPTRSGRLMVSFSYHPDTVERITECVKGFETLQ